MSKINGEFSLQLHRNNNKGQLPLVKQVEFGNSYLIQTLDNHQGCSFFTKESIMSPSLLRCRDPKVY